MSKKTYLRQETTEFMDFIRSKGVVGLAVGLVIGSAVTGVVNSLVGSIINPLIGLLLPASSLAAATVEIGSASVGWGVFVSAFINLIIIAGLVYLSVKWLRLDRLDKKSY